MPRILIVEDDEAIAVALRDGFEFEGYEVGLAVDGEAGRQSASRENWDLILLDVMLPKLSGIDVCKQLRREGSKTPIIMLTARSQEIDKVVGLKIGADDYVTKPFSFLELLARVEALLRRATGRAEGPETYLFGDVKTDFRRMEVSKAGGRVEMSRLEFELLKYFIDHRGQALPRERLLDAVWGYESESQTRTVDMHVAKLRKKLEDDPAHPSWIVTVHRVGYKFTG